MNRGIIVVLYHIPPLLRFVNVMARSLVLVTIAT